MYTPDGVDITTVFEATASCSLGHVFWLVNIVPAVQNMVTDPHVTLGRFGDRFRVTKPFRVLSLLFIRDDLSVKMCALQNIGKLSASAFME